MTRTKKKEPVAKCGVCRKAVADNSYALACDFGCELWYHCDCVGVSVEQHDRLAASDEKWYCDKCGLLNDKILLNEEINNLSKSVSLLQSDYQELQKLYDGVKNQNVTLGELCLRREEEVVKLQEELENCRNILKGRTCTFNNSAADFPPLRLSNRFSCLPLDEDRPTSQTAVRHELSRTWSGGEPRSRAAPGPGGDRRRTLEQRSLRTSPSIVPSRNSSHNPSHNLSFSVSDRPFHPKASTPLSKTYSKPKLENPKSTKPDTTPNLSLTLISISGIIFCIYSLDRITSPMATSIFKPGLFSMVYITAPTQEAAKKIARGLVENQLAACVNIIPGITSVYKWEGKIEEDSELLLVVKTRTQRIEEITSFVKANHPYTVPEVISTPIENGLDAYLKFLDENVPEKK